MALGLTWLFLTNLMETLVPIMIGKTLDAITAAAPLRSIAEIVVWIFVLILFLSLFRYLWRIFWARFHHSVAEDLRNRVFDSMLNLGPSFFRTRKIGQLISLIANDVNSFRMGIGPGFLILFDGLMMIVLILPVMVSISWTWTWQTLVLMPLVPFIVKRILSHLSLEFHNRQERFADLSGSAQEIISGIRVIKSFAQEDNQTQQFNTHSRAFMYSCDRVAKWSSFFVPCLELPVALGSVLLLLLGTPEVIAGTITLGQFFAFYQYIQRMVWPMEAIGVSLSHFQEGWASFRRIREVLEFQPDVPDTGEIEVDELHTLEVRDLSFSYPGSNYLTLDKISFSLKRGECLGVVGMTGSGKSTLIELLTRQYSVPEGTILINGISIEKIKIASLRRLIGIVPQEAFLFSRMVSENIALGMEKWQFADVHAAASQVRLEAEIERWPQGFESLVGERGVNLSGGQKQRLTLARALIRKAPLVILDDALSAVDAKTEEDILIHLRHELEKTTSIVISHRLASVRQADLILVLKNGHTEALGKHQDLIHSSASYYLMYKMQSEGAC